MQIFVINLPSAVERRNFQIDQLSKLGLDYDIIDATSVYELRGDTYKKHYSDWQRPLKNTEIACFYSHRVAWNKVLRSRLPALILEDDALLSSCIPEILSSLNNINDVDLINLENRSRKKFVSKTGIEIACNSMLLRLYQDRTGAAGYILWPSGAEKLITCSKEKGIALADAHITSCLSIVSCQVEPTPIIQLDQCYNYGIVTKHSNDLSISTVSSHNKDKGGLAFRIKRVKNQLLLGLRQLLLFTKSERRYIKIRFDDF